MAPRIPAPKTTDKADPSTGTLTAIAKLVRHPECAEHGGRNRYKREALVQIAELTKDVVVPGEPEPEVEEPETEDVEETEPDEAA